MSPPAARRNAALSVEDDGDGGVWLTVGEAAIHLSADAARIHAREVFRRVGDGGLDMVTPLRASDDDLDDPEQE